MEQHPKWDIKQFIRKTGSLIILLLIGCTLSSLVTIFAINIIRNRNTSEELIQAQAAETIIKEQEETKPPDATETEPEEYATSHNEDETETGTGVPLTDEPLTVSDLYAVEDSVAVFSCYDLEATGYTWEIYNMSDLKWKEAPADDVTTVTDELYRKVSSLMVSAAAGEDGMLVRCTTTFSDREPVSYTATLHILDHKIARIAAEDVSGDVGTYLAAKEIPVTITYENGEKETVTGLNGLYFIESSESSEYSTTLSGNAVETITTVITAREYHMLSPESEDVMLRFPYNGSYLEAKASVHGEDLSAPVISRLDISDFEITNIDKPVPVTVSITAEDNATPYSYLQYAFLPEGQDPTEEDWITDANFDTEIGKNGIWTAYCRDQSGNIGTESRELIVVDNKAPRLSISLEVPEDNWGVSNRIIAEAQDYQDMEYNFTCLTTGKSSGWIKRNEYDVSENSVWKVQVRDAVGNIAEEEVMIRNIDCQKPVINSISVVEEEEKYLEK